MANAFGDVSPDFVFENSGDRLAVFFNGVRHGQVDPVTRGGNGKLVRSDVAAGDRLPELSYDANGKWEVV